MAIPSISFDNATVPNGEPFKEEKKLFNGFSEKYLLSGCNSSNSSTEYDEKFKQIEQIESSTSKSIGSLNTKVLDILSRLANVEKRLDDVEVTANKHTTELHCYYNGGNHGWVNPTYSEKIGGWQ